MYLFSEDCERSLDMNPKIGVMLAFLVLVCMVKVASANTDAERLYDDLINGYNSLIRPVGNNSDRLTVKMALKLSQLIEVVSLIKSHPRKNEVNAYVDQSLKNQIMVTMMWVEQEWTDYKFKWDPEEYGGVSKLHVPSEQIWLVSCPVTIVCCSNLSLGQPDIVLYNK